uniref:Uncharacterized protein n=1 Tax=Rhizophora mucronata TaxID=61149 RepID=A0A2P2QQV3_RHIMU
MSKNKTFDIQNKPFLTRSQNITK